METAELIRERRQAKHITQQKLGEMLGYEGRTAEITIQNWESGRREVPIKKIRQVAELLDLTFDELIP